MTRMLGRAVRLRSRFCVTTSHVQRALLVRGPRFLGRLRQLIESDVVHRVHFTSASRNRSESCGQWLGRHRNDVRLPSSAVANEHHGLMTHVLHAVTPNRPLAGDARVKHLTRLDSDTNGHVGLDEVVLGTAQLDAFHIARISSNMRCLPELPRAGFWSAHPPKLPRTTAEGPEQGCIGDGVEFVYSTPLRVRAKQVAHSGREVPLVAYRERE
jgi:hypothetical protein